MSGLWSAIFGNDHPVEVEIGAGTGTFLLCAAGQSPEHNFFGIERSFSRVERVAAIITAQCAPNARMIAADAACVVSTCIPNESVHAYHVYFPDPWWKRRHFRRRLFTPPFAAALARTLVPNGRVYVATDVDETFAQLVDALETSSFSRDVSARPVRLTPTSFERKGHARGATIKDAVFINRGAPPAGYTKSAAPMTPAESPS